MVLSDRYCLVDNVNVLLSPQDLVSCDTVLNKGCEGGNPVAAWEYMALKGIVSDECFPYTSGKGETGNYLIKSGSCVNKAVQYKKYKSTQPSLLKSKDAVKAELLNGPVESTMMVYDDFPHY